MIKPTMLSNLIEQLQDLRDRRGDMPVAALSDDFGYIAYLEVNSEPYNYDGGVVYPIEADKWERTRTHGDKYPEYAIIQAFPPKPGDLIDDVIVKGR
jgi:hypothetical protein